MPSTDFSLTPDIFIRELLVVKCLIQFPRVTYNIYRQPVVEPSQVGHRPKSLTIHEISSAFDGNVLNKRGTALDPNGFIRTKMQQTSWVVQAILEFDVEVSFGDFILTWNMGDVNDITAKTYTDSYTNETYQMHGTMTSAEYQHPPRESDQGSIGTFTFTFAPSRV